MSKEIEYFGDRLRRLREGRGLARQALAVRGRISAQTIGGYETDPTKEQCVSSWDSPAAYEIVERVPSAATIIALAEALGVTPNYLRYGQEEAGFDVTGVEIALRSELFAAKARIAELEASHEKIRSTLREIADATH